MSLKNRNFLKLLDYTPAEIEALLDLAADIEAFDADRSLIFCGNLCSGLLIHQIFNDNAIRLRSLSTCSTRTFTCW